MSELVAICCCDAAPGQCSCPGCPTSVLATVDVDVSFAGMPTTCPTPFFSWVAEDVLVAGGTCRRVGNTPLGSLSYQSPYTSCGSGQVQNWNGSTPMNPSFVDAECAITASALVPDAVKQYLSTPTCWRVRLNLIGAFPGDQWWLNAWYDRPTLCLPTEPPQCIEAAVILSNVLHAATIAGSIGSAEFPFLPGATASVDQWVLTLT